MTAADRPSAKTKRNIAALIAAQAILGAQMPVYFVLGGLSGKMLASNPCWATLPISLIVLGSMISAPPLAAFMGRFGRRAGFFLGTFGGAFGALLCTIALYSGSFALFLIGSFITGLYFCAHGFYRFAASDSSEPAFRPKAISWVMAGGLISAILGPFIVRQTGGAAVSLPGLDLPPVPFAAAYLSMVVLNVLGSAIFLFLDIPKPKPPKAGTDAGRSRWELLKSPGILVAMIVSMVAYALMNLVMTSTPLAVVGCGFTPDDAANIVSAHVLAMYVPSFFTGPLIARFGTRLIIATGLVLLAGAGIVGLSGVDLGNFYLALVLLGIGWNFGFIGGTTMLAQYHTPEEATRAQGMNDFAVFGMVTLASLSSGILMNCSGGDPVSGWTAVNIAMVPLLMLAGGALIWLTLAGARRAPTA
ncbi:MFS transporter [Oceanomicrobium pacificus]|uniref:MFS transporter n=1 Tax=Oceanomicrobium pacificus TaxID=2692916 RepID=A0A6B0TN30_9RHOB|nr:MFS transporter [Oceanomicrobium pacificus]MXU65937.1 MFS transporter [Oceanomicrobium pacificus]